VGSPTYSSNVPGAFIYDPITSSTVANTLSMSSLAPNSRIHTTNSDALNTSFTFEMFIQIKGEPAAYHNFANRIGANTDKWQIDFDHGNKGSFGRPRVRMDTPDGDNVNYVTAQAGWTNLPSDRRFGSIAQRPTMVQVLPSMVMPPIGQPWGMGSTITFLGVTLR
jgi:hypothetical protein